MDEREELGRVGSEVALQILKWGSLPLRMALPLSSGGCCFKIYTTCSALYRDAPHPRKACKKIERYQIKELGGNLRNYYKKKTQLRRLWREIARKVGSNLERQRTDRGYF